MDRPTPSVELQISDIIRPNMPANESVLDPQSLIETVCHSINEDLHIEAVGSPDLLPENDPKSPLIPISMVPDHIGSECAAESHSKLDDTWVCAICLDKIKVEETAQIKGCEHSYCVTCILRWAMHKPDPWCPQCRLPFSSLLLFKGLDGSLCDYMCEESTCLLLRASWFMPLAPVEEWEAEDEYYYPYQDDDDDFFDVYDEQFYTSSIRLGNRRWGDTGYVCSGRKEARPIGVRQIVAPTSRYEASGSSSSSSSSKDIKEPAKETKGRRAKRAQKREAADMIAMAK